MAFIRWRVLEALVAVDVANMPSTARADELTASTIPLLVYGALHAVPECLYSLIHFIGSFVTADFKGEHTSTRTNDNGQKETFRAKSKQQVIAILGYCLMTNRAHPIAVRRQPTSLSRAIGQTRWRPVIRVACPSPIG